MAMAYKLTNTDIIKDAGLRIRTLIKRAFKVSAELPWPPTAHDLPPNDGLLSTEREQLLSFVLVGQSEVKEECEKTRCLVLFIGQDICRATTEGQWKLPKHILICTIIHHLYCGKQLTTIINPSRTL